MTFTASEVRNYYASRFSHLKLTNQREWRMPCPIHSGTNPSFAINSETGLAQCHSQCGRGWDIISLEMEISGLDFPKAKERVYEVVGRPNVPWEERNVQAIYDYTDASGKLLYQVLRYFGKEFKQRRPDGKGGWVWGLGDTKRVPFRLPRVHNSGTVAVCEGEKDVLTLERLDLCATCNNGGAGNFRPELAQYFSDKHVIIFPDNDDPGREHALKVAAILAPVAKSLKIVELEGVPLKGDVTDFINAGGTLDAIRELYRKARPWTPDFEFGSVLPNENDRYVRTIAEDVDAAGGFNEFWDLAKLDGLRTPWPKLSHSIGGGLRASEVYVLGANQGAGKTSLALQFAIAAMRREEGVLLFSMEMTWRAVFHRMAGIEARVNLNELQEAQITLRRRDLPPEDKTTAQRTANDLSLRLVRSTSELGAWPLLVSTKASVTPEYIVEETRRLTKKKSIRLVIVDHMQLMSTTGKARDDYEKFTAISRAMKQTASEINVPVLLVSQTSRAQSRDRRKEINVSDLRGSGAIEEDAAGVFLLYEDADDSDKALNDGERYAKGPVKTWLKVGKNRYGPAGVYLALEHHKSITRFDLPNREETQKNLSL